MVWRENWMLLLIYIALFLVFLWSIEANTYSVLLQLYLKNHLHLSIDECENTINTSNNTQNLKFNNLWLKCNIGYKIISHSVLLGSQISSSQINCILTLPSDQKFLLTILEKFVFFLSPLSAIVVVSETEVQGLEVSWESVEFSQKGWEGDSVFIGEHVQHLGEFSDWQVLVLEGQLWSLRLGFTICDADEVLYDWVDLHLFDDYD